MARSLPENGNGVTPPAASIPGKRSAADHRAVRRIPAASMVNPHISPAAKQRSRVRTCDGSNPGFVARKLLKLLISNPAPARSNIDNATCAMIRRERARCDSGPTAPRLPSCRDSFTFGRDTCRAGKTAKSKVLATAATKAKTMTTQRGPMG